MSNEAFVGYGSFFKVGDGLSPQTFTSVAGLRSITPGALSTQVLEKTHHESPNAHREKLPGLKETSAFVIEGDLMPADATQKNSNRGLVGLWKSRTVFDFRVVLADAALTSSDNIEGFVSSFKYGAVTVDGVVSFTAEITPVTQASIL